MARHAPSCDLDERSWTIGGVRFSVATRADDGDIRSLLREVSLAGSIRLSFQREPDAFAATFGLALRHGFVIARAADSNDLVGLCEKTVRSTYVDGEVRPLPYLGALRVRPAYRNRISILRRGFEAVRTLLHDPRDLPFSLTSIASDNKSALRLLCAGLKGLPTYSFAGELSTFAMRTSARRIADCVTRGSDLDLPEIAALLHENNRGYQFAAHWPLNDLRFLAERCLLRPSDFLIIRRNGAITACAALWDQSHEKQTIVAGYAPTLGRLRPIANAFGRMSGAPNLPTPGTPLKQIFFSHMAIGPSRDAEFAMLVSAALSFANRRGFDVMLVGLATKHAYAEILRKQWRTQEYRTRLHTVDWNSRLQSGQTSESSFASALPYPEIALL